MATIKAPTTMKALKPSDRPAKLSGSKVRLATARMAVKTMLTMNTASMDQATQVQRLRTVGLAPVSL
jgi:hypothetical protein